MILAIPTREGMVDDHFGHCAYYTVIALNDQKQVEHRFRHAGDGHHAHACRQHGNGCLQQAQRAWNNRHPWLSRQSGGRPQGFR